MVDGSLVASFGWWHCREVGCTTRASCVLHTFTCACAMLLPLLLLLLYWLPCSPCCEPRLHSDPLRQACQLPPIALSFIQTMCSPCCGACCKMCLDPHATVFSQLLKLVPLPLMSPCLLAIPAMSLPCHLASLPSLRCCHLVTDGCASCWGTAVQQWAVRISAQLCSTPAAANTCLPSNSSWGAAATWRVNGCPASA